jgi:alkanesulfonate monooxygenase SsuD/methylene tetrahydromethanopterin reductase-like flavin-dependent oxidoreductase (luciferase family)
VIVKFGLGILSGQVPVGGSGSFAREYADMLLCAELAEELGFDSVWLTEHHFAADGYLPSVLPIAAAVAARTRRITIGTAAILAPFHHPLRLAEDAAVVDQLSGGRLILGLALGWREEEFRGFRIQMSERAGRLEETVAVLRLAWSGARFSFTGRHFEFDRVRVTPSPAHPIRIWIGAGSPRSIERAAVIGDGYVASKTTLADFSEKLALADHVARAAEGRDFALAVMLDAWIGSVDPEVHAGIWYKTDVYRHWREGQDVPGRDLNVGVAPTDLPVPFIHGEPASVAAQLMAYLPLARGHELTLIVRLHYPGLAFARTAAAMRRFASSVMPQVRQWAAQDPAA